MFVNKFRALFELTELPVANKAKIIVFITKFLSCNAYHAT